MLGYICKYTPVEIFTSMGVDIQKVEPRVANFTQADTMMHANICSYIKGVLEEIHKGGYEGLILTDCCDSSRRLYDALKKNFPHKFFYLLDVPRKTTDFAVSIYGRRIMEMVKDYEDFSGKTFSQEKLLKVLQKNSLQDETPKEKISHSTNLNMGIMGARCNGDVIKLLEDHQVDILFNITCTGLTRNFHINNNRMMESYFEQLMYQIPCMRMTRAANRGDFVEGFTDRLDGILYHTMKFCDNYSYEYADIKEQGNIPVLQVETDGTSQSLGQIRTRVEAFIEELKIKKGIYRNLGENKKLESGKMYVLGIDSGSTSTNAVIINERKEIIASHVVRTGAKTADSADRILREILEKADLDGGDIKTVVSTGYGRVSIPFADSNVTEISCHGKGAHFLNPGVRTILDIGGQDSKAIRLNDKGEVVDFVMNDKCAAGTGRFLEMMARTLEVPIEKLGPVSLKWKENIDISSMCSVFAESEVISLIALNKEKADIAHGVHKAIAGKAVSLLKKVGLEKEYMMTGGVAKNPGVIAVLEEILNAKLYIYEEPEIVGALGAALFGLESCGL